MALQLLLDSADPAAWDRWFSSGLIQGITTNPTLLLRAGQPCTLAHLGQLCCQAADLGARELHLQAWGGDADALLRCGQALAQLNPHLVVVKLPLTAAGVAAARALIAAAVPITFTACYEVPQVLIAAALGARYVAAYLGRISDRGRDGQADLVAMQRCLDGLGAGTRLLAASLRRTEDLVPLAAAGVHCFTIAPELAAALFSSDATGEAAAQFERDAATGGG